MAVVVFLTFLAGLWLLTPWAIPALQAPAVSAGFNWTPLIGALINLAVCLPALWAVRQGTPKAISWGALVMFNWFLFVVLVRLILMPLGSTAFVTPLMVALIMAVVHIEQSAISKGRVEGGEDA